MAMAVGRPAQRTSLLLVADPRPLTPEAAGCVQLLELLAAHAASCLRTADAIAELRERAASDALTGLGHHATFHEALAAARAAGATVAVLLIDVDGFKAINDAKGHQAGDRVLREISAVLTRRAAPGGRAVSHRRRRVRRAGQRGQPAGGDGGRPPAVRRRRPGRLGHRVDRHRPAAHRGGRRIRAGPPDRALYAVKESGRDGVEIDA